MTIERKLLTVCLVGLVVIACVYYFVPDRDVITVTRAELYEGLGNITYQQNQKQAELRKIVETIKRGTAGYADSAAVMNRLLVQHQEVVKVIGALDGQKTLILLLLDR